MSEIKDHIDTDDSGDEKYLPLDISNELLMTFVKELMAMMPEDNLFAGENVKVIPEAHGYITKERAIAAEKIGIIAEMTGLIGTFRRNWKKEDMERDADPKRKEMDNVMDRVLAMVNPEEREKARALISRIWKYFEENEKNTGEGASQKRVKHYTLSANLEAEFTAREIYPLTDNESRILIDSLASLKKGPSQLSGVLSRLNDEMMIAARHASPHSRRAREIAKFRKENLAAYSNSFHELNKIRDYIVAKAKEMGWK